MAPAHTVVDLLVDYQCMTKCIYQMHKYLYNQTHISKLQTEMKMKKTRGKYLENHKDDSLFFSPHYSLGLESRIMRTDVSGLDHTRREWTSGARAEEMKMKREKRERAPMAFFSPLFFCFSSFLEAFLSSLDDLTFFLLVDYVMD